MDLFLNMTKRTTDLNHAEHNYNLHSQLLADGNYDDWVITTGFYSGMKFSQSALFPSDYICPSDRIMRRFENFAEYIRANRSLNQANAHRILENVVETYIEEDEVKNSYKDLKGVCHFARYINYNVGKERVQVATEALEVIKNYHDKTKTT
jgi:hypothetical protein